MTRKGQITARKGVNDDEEGVKRRRDKELNDKTRKELNDETRKELNDETRKELNNDEEGAGSTTTRNDDEGRKGDEYKRTC